MRVAAVSECWRMILNGANADLEKALQLNPKKRTGLRGPRVSER